MKKALLFKQGVDPIVVSADEVKDGKYDKADNFVDLKYEFKVKYVKDCKGHTGPYFRYYLSHDDYVKLSQNQKTHSDIVENMRRFLESYWHDEWKNKVSHFCEIEKYFKNSLGERKIADAYYNKGNVVLEFQHSYIANDFEKRNSFYSELGIKVIWLLDLPNAEIKERDGIIEVLEDNARGFFRIAENEENLRKYPVYVQVKNKKIYRVDKLYRKEINGELKSTIRYFKASNIYTEEEFINGIKMVNDELYCNSKNLHSLYDLWKNNFKWMIVKRADEPFSEARFINCNRNGDMFSDLRTECIIFKYCCWISKDRYSFKNGKEYCLSEEESKREIWEILDYRTK